MFFFKSVFIATKYDLISFQLWFKFKKSHQDQTWKVLLLNISKNKETSSRL